MKRKILSFFLSAIMLCSVVPVTHAASQEAIDAADALYELGLFQGVGTDANGKPIYSLDRAPTRHEAVTMLVRLLGKEAEAKAGTWQTPFTDVDDWAKPYVGYAYTNGLTNGTGPSTYSGNSTVTATQYLTFVLRALGYESGSDFQWDSAWTLTDSLGITNGEYGATSSFTRGDVAVVSYDALSACMKGQSITLLEYIQSAPTREELIQGTWHYYSTLASSAGQLTVERTFFGNQYTKASNIDGSLSYEVGTFRIEGDSVICDYTEYYYFTLNGTTYYGSAPNKSTTRSLTNLSGDTWGNLVRVPDGTSTYTQDIIDRLTTIGVIPDNNSSNSNLFYTSPNVKYPLVKTFTAVTGTECSYSRKNVFDVSDDRKLTGFHHNCPVYEYYFADSKASSSAMTKYSNYLEAMGCKLVDVYSDTLPTGAVFYGKTYRFPNGERLTIDSMTSKYSGESITVTLHSL